MEIKRSAFYIRGEWKDVYMNEFNTLIEYLLNEKAMVIVMWKQIGFILQLMKFKLARIL